MYVILEKSIGAKQENERKTFSVMKYKVHKFKFQNSLHIFITDNLFYAPEILNRSILKAAQFRVFNS